jgi:hypothetical protein
LLGVGVSGLTSEVQRDLFAPDGPRGPRPLDAAVNGIRDRVGDGAVSRARSLPDPASRDEL